jgi:hypothetical protein
VREKRCHYHRCISPEKGSLSGVEKEKSAQKSKTIPALWYNVQTDERAMFLLYTSDCCITQTSATEEVKSWCAHRAAGPDFPRQTHLRADFRAPVATLNYRANCGAEIPCANRSTDLFRTDFWRLQN